MKLIISLLMIFAFIYSTAKSDLIPFINEDQQLGYINDRGVVIIEPEYDQPVSYVRYTYNGEVYPGVEFTPYTLFSEGLATVRKATKLVFFNLWHNYYVIDETGKRVFKCGDDIVFNYSDGVAPKKFSDQVVDVTKPIKNWSWVDRNGAEFNPSALRFSYVSQFREGFALVLQGENYGFIDKSGAYLSDPIYEDATLFSEGLASVKIDGKWGYIDKKGQNVIKYKFDQAFQFVGGLARVMDMSAYGFINKSGEYVVKAKYLWATDFTDGLAAVQIDKIKFGYIDATGKITVNKGFTMARQFSEGLGCVEKDGKWGFINTKGDWVIPPAYNFAFGFKQGAAMVWQGSEMFYINKDGKKIATLLSGKNYVKVRKELKP